MMNMNWPKPCTYKMTKDEQSRLAQIRGSLERFTALGWDTSAWEARFFLDLLAKVMKKRVAIRSLK